MEGESTEPQYLRRFKRMHSSPFVEVREVAGAGDPLAVVDSALKEKLSLERARRKGDRMAGRDSVWVMFDRDEHPRFDEAMDKARGNALSLAISNPCFELWGIFHYEDCGGWIHRHECQRRLEELSPAYQRANGKTFDEDVIHTNYATAVERAKRSLKSREEEGIPMGNPSTTVQELTEHIRAVVRRFSGSK